MTRALKKIALAAATADEDAEGAEAAEAAEALSAEGALIGRRLPR